MRKICTPIVSSILVLASCLVSLNFISANDSGLAKIQNKLISRWKSTSPLHNPTSIASALRLGRYIYFVGGERLMLDPASQMYFFASTKHVYRAAILSGGQLGKWELVNSSGLPEISHTDSEVSEDGWIYIVGGLDNEIESDKRSQMLLDPSSILARRTDTFYGRPEGNQIVWEQSVHELHPARNFHQVSRINKTLIVAGGCLNPDGISFEESFLDEVRYSQVSSVGELSGEWQYGATLNSARCAHAAVSYKDWIYVLGGSIPSNGTPVATGTVEFAQLRSDKTLSPWTYTTELPPLSHLTANVTEEGTIIVIGGQNGFEVSDKVYFADIDEATGSLGQWKIWHNTRAFTLPRTFHSHSAVLGENGSIYIMGGETNVISSNGIENQLSQETYYIPPLAISKSSTPSGLVSGGDTLRYTIAYTNNSFISQTITITDILPKNAILDPASISLAGKAHGRELIWHLDTLAPGDAGHVSFDVRIPDLLTVTPAVPSKSVGQHRTLGFSDTVISYVKPTPIVCGDTHFSAVGTTLLDIPVDHTLTQTVYITVPTGNKSNGYVAFNEGQRRV